MRRRRGPGQTEKRYAAYLGRTARQDGPARTFDLPGAAITLVPAAALADRLPGERPPGIPGFAAYTVTVRDLPAAERLLAANGVPLGRTSAGDPFVPSAEALGVAIIFQQANLVDQVGERRRVGPGVVLNQGY